MFAVAIAARYREAVQKLLIATDSDRVAADVAAAADNGVTVLRVRRGRDVNDAVTEHGPDVVTLDMQIGSMGGIATAIQLRQEAEAGRQRDVDIVLLVDRPADAYTAAQADADAVVNKPFTLAEMREALNSLGHQ